MPDWFRKVHSSYVEPLSGRTVILYQYDFDSIKSGSSPHSSAHPEIETHYDVVKKTIESPDCVKRDSDVKNGEVYYCWYSGDRDYPNHHMKVVLRRTKHGKLIVINAYFTRNLKETEIIIWDKQNGFYE